MKAIFTFFGLGRAAGDVAAVPLLPQPASTVTTTAAPASSRIAGLRWGHLAAGARFVVNKTLSSRSG
jgi:hypothetical protein